MNQNLPIELQQTLDLKQEIKKQEKEKFNKMKSEYEQKKIWFEEERKKKQKILDKLLFQKQDLQAEKKDISQKYSTIEQENEIIAEQIKSIEEEIALMEERDNYNIQNIENEKINLLEQYENIKKQQNHTILQLKSNQKVKLMKLKKDLGKDIGQIEDKSLQQYNEYLQLKDELNELTLKGIEQRLKNSLYINKMKEIKINEYCDEQNQQKFQFNQEIIKQEEQLYKINKENEHQIQQIQQKKYQQLQELQEQQQEYQNLTELLSKSRMDFCSKVLQIEEMKQKIALIQQQNIQINESVCHQKILNQELFEIESEKKQEKKSQNINEIQSLNFDIQQRKKTLQNLTYSVQQRQNILQQEKQKTEQILENMQKQFQEKIRKIFENTNQIEKF